MLLAAVRKGTARPIIGVMAWMMCLALLVLAEIIFFVILRIMSSRWKRPLDILKGDIPRSHRTPVDILRMVEDHISRSRKDAEDFFSHWHFDTPTSKLRRRDIEDFLIWNAFTRRREEITDEELQLVLATLSRVEQKLDLKWSVDGQPQGHRHSAHTFAAHTWESNPSYNHCPLLVYMCIFVLKKGVGPILLMILGFRYRTRGILGYWVREKDCKCGRNLRRARQDGPQEALMFFHGISPGLVVYLQFLMRFRHQKVVLIELHWVTLNPFCTSVPTCDEFCNTITDILDENGIAKVCLSAHSYGSFMVAWLLFFPKLSGRISRVVIVSGPALNLFLSKTCKVVCYDKPFWFEYCLAHVFFRQFYWHQCVLTARDLPKGSTVVLVEHDELIPVPDVVRDCEEHGVRCHVIPRTRHAFEIFMPLACAKTVQFIRQASEEPVNNGKGVNLFFHTARSSKLYGAVCNIFLPAMDAIANLFVMRGHSPFNLQMLSSCNTIQ